MANSYPFTTGGTTYASGQVWQDNATWTPSPAYHHHYLPQGPYPIGNEPAALHYVAMEYWGDIWTQDVPDLSDAVAIIEAIIETRHPLQPVRIVMPNETFCYDGVFYIGGSILYEFGVHSRTELVH